MCAAKFYPPFHSLGSTGPDFYRQAVVEGKQNLGDLSTLEDYTALEGLKSVVVESKLQEVRKLAFAIWTGRVQAGGSYFGHDLSDWLTARDELGRPLPGFKLFLSVHNDQQTNEG